MANIAIIGSDAQHKSSTSLRDILQAPPNNHACTLLADTSNTSLLSFDLIITTRVNAGVSGYTNVLDAFNSGVPVICGMDQALSTGIGPTAPTVAGKIGLTSSIPDGSNQAFGVIPLSTIFQPYFLDGAVITTHSASDFSVYTPFDLLANGAVAHAASSLDVNNRCYLAIAPKGSLSLLNTSFPAACAFAGFIYSNYSNYTPDGAKLIALIVDEVLDANLTAVISGYSLNENAEPVSSDIYVYKHDDGSLFKKTTTNADGSYSVTVGTGEYFVVCNNQDRDSNLQVLGYIKGVE